MPDLVKLIPQVIKRGETDGQALLDAFELCRNLFELDSVEVDGEPIYDKDNLAKAIEYSAQIRTFAVRTFKQTGLLEFLELVKKTLLFEAPYKFDSYCRYIEWNRPPEKRFYEPRRKQLRPIADALQDLADDKLDVLAISCPPGIGKTTIAIFYLTWIGGRQPDLPMLGGSHSNSFLRGVYDEVLRVIDPNGEYLYNDVFPKAFLADTNAKDMRIDLHRRKRFQTFEFSSIGSGNAGKVRAASLLYCDDLVDGIETAMSKDRLDKLYQQYYTDLRQRKIGLCKELHIATRWSIWDVIGRIEQQYEGSDRARFVRFAALDENDESNFDYPYNLGFTTEFYREQRQIMDDASWRALYMNEPIERLGRLYDPEELKRFFELPDAEPDAIITVCDTKEQGNDFLVMPIAYQFGDNFYIDKIVCDNGKVEVLEDKVAQTLCERKVKMCQFESNRGGTIFAQNVRNKVKSKGGITSITTKWTQTNKETRIITNSGWVKEHCIFKDETLYSQDREYRDAMNMLCGYTMSGKNKHDDVPDCFSMLAEFVQGFAGSRIEIAKRPF